MSDGGRAGFLAGAGWGWDCLGWASQSETAAPPITVLGPDKPRTTQEPRTGMEQDTLQSLCCGRTRGVGGRQNLAFHSEASFAT